MKPRTPEECDELFARHLNAGDLDGLVSLYEPRAVLVQQDRSIAAGTAAVREGLAGFVAMKPRITMNVIQVVRVGDDLAALYNDWSLTATGPDGASVSASGKAIELTRRQSDGSWLFALDDPFARG
jgi:uncharacterized protein (TIGR02246 family)